jgi:hypothetical protein
MLQRWLICFILVSMILRTAQAQVNLQTGSATFSLPMFNWKDDKSRLDLDVVLSYNSGNGVKTSELASNVGQGWNLYAGGMIVRLPMGEPDDQLKNGSQSEHDITKYPDGFLHTSISPGLGCPLALTKYPIYGGKNEKYRQHNDVAADKQLDYFSFQFNGKSGLFVLDPAAGSNKCASLGDSKMIITFNEDYGLASQGIRTTITSFTIQDDDGLIYRFKDHGMNKVLESKFCDRSLTQFQEQPAFKPGGIYHQAGFDNPAFVNPWIIGSWYLTEIEDPFTHRKVTFSYETRTINSVAGVDISWDEWHDYIIINHKTSLAQVPFISTITCPDGNKVTFKYGKDRIDLPGDKVLTSVDFTYSAMGRSGIETRFLSRYLLNASYFILNRYGAPVSTFQKKMARLCLRSVTKLGPDLKEDSPPYSFDYFLGSNPVEDFVPPPFCASHDIWGFYNGFNSVGYANNEIITPFGDVSTLNFNQLKGLCFMHNGVPISGVYLNPKDRLAKNGLLKQIIYPTGGTLSYDYAQNTGVLDVDGNGSPTMVGGVHVSKTSITDGGYSNGCANPIVTQYNYVTASGQSSLWGLEMPKNTSDLTMHYAPEKRNYRWSFRKCNGSIYGCCYYAFVNPGVMTQTQALSLNDFQRFMMNNEETLGIISGVMTILDIVIVATGSTGVLSIVALALDVISSWIELGVTCLRDNTKDGTTITHHSIDMNGISPLPAQFKRVEVVDGSGASGKTVHVFTSADDYPIWVKYNPRLTARQRFGPWLYGLPKLTTEYDVSGKKVKETETKYFTDFSKRIIEPLANGVPTPPHGVASNLVNCKCLVKKNASQRYTDWVQPEKYGADYQLSDHLDGQAVDLAVEFYPLYTGRMLQDSLVERVYRKGDDTKYVETITGIYYDGNFEQVQTETLKSSDGNLKVKTIIYSKNMSGGIIDVMKQNNLLTVPIRILEYADGGYLNETVNEYVQTANGDIKLYRTLAERTDHPLNTQNWSFYSGPTTTDYSKFKVSGLFSYDASGNLITAKDEGGRSIANIYDYNDKYVAASVINADAAVDKPAYTSFETGSLGGWQLAAGATYANSAVTGNVSLNLAGNSCSATLNTSKPYILSFWAGSGVTVSTGSTLVKSAPTINGFTYYEYNIAAGTGTVTVSGNALIDELRVYPKNSRMRTVTYDPIVGKTSDCDDNNHVTYYEYDNLARMVNVRDENRNIVKHYEYNNVSKQNGCPGTYYNQQITEYFRRSNCGVDFIGEEKSYTVPANKYSSTLSQEDADKQAEQEISTQGQQTIDQTAQCIQLYFNSEHYQDFESTNCEDGYYGGTVRYTVPARRYSSTVAGEADQMALDDITANGQAYANDPAHAVCLLDTYPEWVWQEGDPTECRVVNGEGHLFKYCHNANANSSPAYSWQDAGPDGNCPVGPFYSDDLTDYYRPTNCPIYWDPYPTFVSMPAGSYVSYISTQDANDKAYAAAIAIANTRNSCVGPLVYTDVSISTWQNDNPGMFETVFTSQLTGEQYYMYAIHEAIPEGSYDIYCNVSSGFHNNDYDLYMCGFVAHGAPYWLYNIYISDANCNYVYIYPHQH